MKKKPGRPFIADIRQQQLLKVAIKIAIKKGYLALTSAEISKAMGFSKAYVNTIYPTIKLLREAMLKDAIKKEVLPIIAQIIIFKDKHVSKISKEIHNKALDFFKK